MFSFFLSLLLLLQPTFTWTDFDRIQISGADYAYVENETEHSTPLLAGTYILGSVAWSNEEGILSYLLEPTRSYTVQTFVADPVTEDREVFTITVDPDPLQSLNYIVYQRILWESELNRLMDEQGFTFFEVSFAIQQMRQRLLDEGLID